MIGIRCKDGVVLGVEKPVVSKMLVEGSNRRVFAVDRHAGMVRKSNESGMDRRVRWLDFTRKQDLFSSSAHRA